MLQLLARRIALASIVGACLAFAADVGDEQAALATSTAPITGCSASQVEMRAREFARAIREADLDELDAVWGDRFEWFSVTIQQRGDEGNHFVAYSPKKALRYIEKMDGLPMRLGNVERNGKYRGAADFEYTGAWQPSRALVGKGNMLCASRQIRVWSMAVRPPRP